jgi:hypothetical protein
MQQRPPSGKKTSLDGQIKLEFQTIDIQQSTRGDKIRKYTHPQLPEDNADDGSSSSTPCRSLGSPLQRTDREQKGRNGSVELTGSHTASLAVDEIPDEPAEKGRIVIDPKQVAQEVADWLKQYVNWAEWGDFVKQACDSAEEAYAKGAYPKIPSSRGFHFPEHLRAHTPSRPSETWQQRRVILAECIVRSLASGMNNCKEIEAVLNYAYKLAIRQVLPGDLVLAWNNSH